MQSRALRAVLACAFALVYFAATCAGARAAIPAAALVHAGDKLHVTVAGEDELTTDVIVAADGTIGLPLAGQVRVAGASAVDAVAAISTAYKPYVRDPRVSIDIAERGEITVTVLGAVANSGTYKLRPGATLSAAITAAGGMSNDINGAYPVARIANADGTAYNISLDLLLRAGDPTRDVVLRDGSAVYVPGPTIFHVVVLGAVDRPGTIPINQGDKLSIAIAKAGNSANSKADLTRISVSRTEADGTRTAHPVDLYKALERGDGRFDPTLRADDVIYVPMASKSQHVDILRVFFSLSRLLFLL